MLKQNQEVLKKARAELMVITESLGKRDNSINIVEEKPAPDPMALMRSVDEMIAQLNEAKQITDATSVTTIHTSNTTREPEAESSESDWWSGQGQLNRNKINSDVNDSLSIHNDFELFATQQVYTSIDTCLWSRRLTLY